MGASSAAFDDRSAPAASRRATRASMVTSSSGAYNRARHLDRIVTNRAVSHVFQPLVDLESREVVAYEALTRGPIGTPMESPGLLFTTARELGLIAELDWVCRATAMERALEAGFGTTLTLFVNVEPDVAATRAPEDLVFILKHAQRDLRVVLEVTERSLLERPAELLHWLNFAREQWWGVALDDVGATSESLALMPFVRPDVIKLDAHLVNDVHTEEDKRVLEAVHDYADRTKATIVAEGIESKAHVLRAHEELGATLGQGWYFGRPTALPRRLPAPRRAVTLLEPPATAAVRSPWALISAARPTHSLPEAAVRRRMAQVEQAAMVSRDAPVVLGCVPAGPGPWSPHEEQFDRLARYACFAGVVGQGLEAAHHRRWQSGPLPPGDEMANEWVLVSLSPHNAAAVVAFDAHERDERGQRLLECAWTQDPDVVAPIAELLMRRMSVPVVDSAGQLTV